MNSTLNNPILQGCKIRRVIPKPKAKFEAGAILYCSWGYEQTNYDFYIVKKIDPNWIYIVQLENESSAYNSQYMTSVEMPTFKEVGGMIRRKLKSTEWIKISSYKYAYLWDGQPKKATHYA